MFGFFNFQPQLIVISPNTIKNFAPIKGGGSVLSKLTMDQASRPLQAVRRLKRKSYEKENVKRK